MCYHDSLVLERLCLCLASAIRQGPYPSDELSVAFHLVSIIDNEDLVVSDLEIPAFGRHCYTLAQARLYRRTPVS